jgi:hypothetical protein
MKEGVAQELAGNGSNDHQTDFPVVSKPNGQTQQAMPVRRDVPEIDDFFDPAGYRKPQDPRLSLGSEQSAGSLPNTIEARKPKKSWFIRVNPDPSYHVILPLYTDDDSKRRESNSYLFVPGLEIPLDLGSLVRDTLVVAAITSTGISFLYTLAVTDSTWHDSGIEAIRLAMERWVRITPSEGCYSVTFPIADLPEPRFPDVPFRDYLERAFAKRLIKSLDDPLIKKLRGVL